MNTVSTSFISLSLISCDPPCVCLLQGRYSPLRFPSVTSSICLFISSKVSCLFLVCCCCLLLILQKSYRLLLRYVCQHNYFYPNCGLRCPLQATCVCTRRRMRAWALLWFWPGCLTPASRGRMRRRCATSRRRAPLCAGTHAAEADGAKAICCILRVFE